MYIQIFNKDGQPVFVDMGTGKACWILPSGISLGSVLYMAHYNEESGLPYYEKLSNNAVSWTLPVQEMTQKARIKVESILSMTLLETQKELNEIFDLAKSTAHMTAIDDYLLYQEECANGTINPQAKINRNDVYVSSDEDDVIIKNSSSVPIIPASKDLKTNPNDSSGEDKQSSINSTSSATVIEKSMASATKINALQMTAQRKSLKSGASVADGPAVSPLKQNTVNSSIKDNVQAAESSNIKTAATTTTPAAPKFVQQSPGFLFKIDEVDESDDEDAISVAKVNHRQQTTPESESTSVSKSNPLSTTKPINNLPVAPPPSPAIQQKISSLDAPISSAPPPPPGIKKTDSNVSNSSNSAPLPPAPPLKVLANEKKPSGIPTPPPPPAQPANQTLPSATLSSTSPHPPPPPPPGSGEPLSTSIKASTASTIAVERKVVPENIPPEVPDTSPSDSQKLRLSSSVDTGAVIAGKLFATIEGNKPIVRLVFDAYMKENKTIDAQVLQDLCYDFGAFYSMHEIKMMMRKYCNKSGTVLTYENFMVWWRSESKVNSVKLTDPTFKRKNTACEYFKRFDPQRNGFITALDYASLHPLLIEGKIINSCLLAVDCIPLLVEKTFNQQSGEQWIQFTDYVSWIESVDAGTDNGQKSAFKKIVSGIRRASIFGFKTPSKESTTLDGLGKKEVDSSDGNSLTGPPSSKDKSGNESLSSSNRATEQRLRNDSSSKDDDEEDDDTYTRTSNRWGGDTGGGKVSRSRENNSSDDDHGEKALSAQVESKTASGSEPVNSKGPSANNALRQAMRRRQSMKKTVNPPVKESSESTKPLTKPETATAAVACSPKKGALSVQGIFGTIDIDSADDDDDDSNYRKVASPPPVKESVTLAEKIQNLNHPNQIKVAGKNEQEVAKSFPFQNNFKKVQSSVEVTQVQSQIHQNAHSSPVDDSMSNDALSYQDKIKKFRQAEQAQEHVNIARKPSPQPLKNFNLPPEKANPPPPPTAKSSPLDIEQGIPFQQKGKAAQGNAEKKSTHEDSMPKSKLSNPMLFRPAELDDDDDDDEEEYVRSPNTSETVSALPRRNSKTRLRAVRAKSAAAPPPPPPPKLSNTQVTAVSENIPDRSDKINRSLHVSKSFGDSTDSTSSNEKSKLQPEFIKDQKLQATVNQLRNALSHSNIQLKRTPDPRPQQSPPDQSNDDRDPSPAKDRFEALKSKFVHHPPPPPRQPSPMVRVNDTETISASGEGMRQVNSPIKKIAAKVAFQLPGENLNFEPEIVSPLSLPPPPPSTTKQKLLNRLSPNLMNRSKAKELQSSSNRSTPTPPKFRWNESMDDSIDEYGDQDGEEEIFSPISVKPLKVLNNKLASDSMAPPLGSMTDLDEGSAIEYTPAVFSTPQDHQEQYTLFQQLLRERTHLTAMRKELDAAEKASMKRIAEAEAASQHRLQGFEAATQAKIAHQERTAQWMMTKMVSEHQQRVKADRTALANERSALAEATERFNVIRRLGEEQLSTLANHLLSQQQKQQLDRKQLLRQRFHLDVALQNLNSMLGGGPSLVAQKINMLASAARQEQDQEQQIDDNISMVTSVNSSTQGGFSRVRSIRSSSSTSPMSVYSTHDVKLSHANLQSSGANNRRNRAISPTTVLRTVSPAPLMRFGQSASSGSSKSGSGLGSRSVSSLTLGQPQSPYHHSVVSAPTHAYTGAIPPSFSTLRRSTDELIAKPPFK